jgi:hypothetical protein
MRIANLSFWFCLLLIGQTGGADSGDEYAHQLCERDKQRMVNTNVLSPTQRLALDSEEDQIRKQIAKVLMCENPIDIEQCQIAFHDFVNRYTALAEQAHILKE